MYEFPDGHVECLKCFVPSAFQKIDADVRARGGVRFYDVADDDPLHGPRFYNCWRRTRDDRVMVDMPLAREQRMREIRAERDARLSDADGPTAREMEQNGKDAAAWKAYKQALRDVPAQVDLSVAETPEALEALEPQWPRRPDAI